MSIGEVAALFAALQPYFGKGYYGCLPLLGSLINEAEMVMRFSEGLRPAQGISNFNVWKIRRDLVADLHESACNAAKLGVIYTTYVDKDEVVLDGSLVTKKDVPRWFDVIMEQTDVVIRTFSKTDNSGTMKFFASVETSKIPQIKTGRTVDVTDCNDSKIGLKNLITGNL